MLRAIGLKSPLNALPLSPVTPNSKAISTLQASALKGVNTQLPHR